MTRALGPGSLRLLVIADLGPDGAPPDPGRVEAALEGGAGILQLRAKHAGARALFEAALALVPLCRAAGVPLLVNDRPDVARATGADGAHVGPDDLPPGAARRVLGELLLGVSARSADRVAAAEAAGAAYLGTGALRPTGTKSEARVIGLEGIAAIAASTRIPVLAIGGVRPEDAAALRRAGAAGMAVVSGVLGAPDPEAAARAYVEAWERG